MSVPESESAGREGPQPAQWSLWALFALTAVVAVLCGVLSTVDLLSFLKAGGIVGLAIVATGVFLIPAGIVLLFVARTRRTFLIYGATAGLPVVLGLLGTWLGHRSIQAAVRQVSEGLDQAMLDHGYRVAWSTTTMGLVVGVSILVIAAIGGTRQWNQTAGRAMGSSGRPDGAS